MQRDKRKKNPFSNGKIVEFKSYYGLSDLTFEKEMEENNSLNLSDLCVKAVFFQSIDNFIIYFILSKCRILFLLYKLSWNKYRK